MQTGSLIDSNAFTDVLLLFLSRISKLNNFPTTTEVLLQRQFRWGICIIVL